MFSRFGGGNVTIINGGASVSLGAATGAKPSSGGGFDVFSDWVEVWICFFFFF